MSWLCLYVLVFDITYVSIIIFNENTSTVDLKLCYYFRDFYSDNNILFPWYQWIKFTLNDFIALFKSMSTLVYTYIYHHPPQEIFLHFKTVSPLNFVMEPKKERPCYITIFPLKLLQNAKNFIIFQGIGIPSSEVSANDSKQVFRDLLERKIFSFHAR